MTENQNPEQKARDTIDALLTQAGWVVQTAKKIDLNVGQGQAVREYQTDVGPADYVLFVDKKAVGVIEAKREEQGHKITEVESQTEGYAAARLKWVSNKEPLPFLYESTGIITRFTDGRDPKPRSREVFSFHRPETLKKWLSQGESLRARLHHIPPLNSNHLPAKELRLRDCQETAITNLEASFKADRPRALIQMATGAGKTYTAITSIYRLLKHAQGKRVLFLVDTKNLGEQAEQEMMNYLPLDDNRNFTQLYNVQRLTAQWRAENQGKLETANALLKRIQQERAQRYQQQLADWEKSKSPSVPLLQRGKTTSASASVPHFEKGGLGGICRGTSKPKAPKHLPPLTPEELAELPQLTEGWGWVRLASIVTVISGYAFKSGDFVSAGVPVVKIANVGYSEFVDKDQEYLDGYFLQTQKDFLISPDDFLLALTRPITNNRTKVCRYPKGAPLALLNQRVSAMKDVEVNPEFLYAYFGTSLFKESIRSKFSETLQPNLSPKDLEACPIPICGLAEQAQIFCEIEARLSEVDQLELTIATSLQQAEALRQSILKKAFSGQLVPQDPHDEPAPELLARIRAERATAEESSVVRKRGKRG